ncbi:zinc finger protein 260-like [Zerene cesonia]|uniref:zinc finger protein 260-like n=1 Tax=Zerene cesonia TaxID=33412 RepID=UPI0018E54A34|nr:zinc finger protein 260-like [Zerene cesonia]
MNEPIAQNVCRTCLSIKHKLKPMNHEELFVYNRLLLKDCTADTMYICVFCTTLLNKINKFIKQCKLAEQRLNNFNMDTSIEMKLTYNFSISAIEINYYEGEKLIKEEDAFDDDIPLILLSNNSDNGEFEDESSDCLNINSVKEEISAQTSAVEEKADSDPDSIVTSKEDFDKKLYKNKRKEKNLHKSSIPSGFSSRMVRETDEYMVIKLTKEQVLEEMEANRGTEKYKMAPYKCDRCVKGYNFEDVLLSHMEKHTPKNGALLCEICGQYCPSATSLRGHIKSHTTKYRCKICNIVRHSRQHVLEHHALVHAGCTREYSCKECDFTTKKRTVMQRHVKMHASNEKHTCHKCGRSFKSREILRVHTSRHDDKNRYHCDHCNRTFIYKSVLHKHIRSVHIDKDFYCVECDAMFTSMEALKQHLYKTKKHSDPSQYKYACAQCDRRFLTRQTLAAHGARAHGAGGAGGAARAARCGRCARAYSTAGALRVHVRRAHSPAAPAARAACPVCEKVFSRKGVLKVHMRVHTGERPYSCECGASFTQLASLKAHEAAKHRK